MSIEKCDAGFDSEARLEQLAAEIREGLIRLDEKWRATVAQAIEVGEWLIEAKALVGVHGQWIPWLREQFPGSVRTAQEYMRLAREKRSVAHLPTVRDAIALLTDPKPKAELKPAPLDGVGELRDAAEAEAIQAAWKEAREAWASGAKYPRLSHSTIRWLLVDLRSRPPRDLELIEAELDRMRDADERVPGLPR